MDEHNAAPVERLARLPFQQALVQARDICETRLGAALSGINLPVADAMLYTTRGGKCLRGFLVLESAWLHGLGPERAGPAAAAIEALHAYSLVHDDLPCMDDDDLRRGQPTVHKKWDEETAVLTGDALQSLAFQLVLETDASVEARVDLAHSLSIAAGVRGMVGGQAMDMAAEKAPTPLTLKEITLLQSGKTGALIEWSAMAGARMVGADTAPLRTFGECLGLAFQIADDILDETGDAAIVGKAVGKDKAAGKATFVSLLGLEEAKTRANSLVEEACDALSSYADEAETLKQAARFVIARDS